MVNWDRTTLRNAATFVFLLLMGLLGSSCDRTNKLMDAIKFKYPTVFSKEELLTVASILDKCGSVVRFTE